jgi:hypothetical protein
MDGARVNASPDRLCRFNAAGSNRESQGGKILRINPERSIPHGRILMLVPK